MNDRMSSFKILTNKLDVFRHKINSSGYIHHIKAQLGAIPDGIQIIVHPFDAQCIITQREGIQCHDDFFMHPFDSFPFCF